MGKFMLFVGGLIALIVLVSSLGPMILLGVSVWLLYIIFKQFIKTDSVAGKTGWVIAGLFILSIALSNIYAVIGIAAAYCLYLVVRKWKNDKSKPVGQATAKDDPFTNFEREWAELHH